MVLHYACILLFFTQYGFLDLLMIEIINRTQESLGYDMAINIWPFNKEYKHSEHGRGDRLPEVYSVHKTVFFEKWLVGFIIFPKSLKEVRTTVYPSPSAVVLSLNSSVDCKL